MTEERPQRFSHRHGYSGHNGTDLIRDDAPESIRCGLLQIAHADLGIRPRSLRTAVSAALRCRPDRDNWTEYPNVWGEVQELVYECDWFRVYDIIEELYRSLSPAEAGQFATGINQLFEEEGIGWQLVNGEIQTRGDEAFEQMMSDALTAVDESGLDTAASELHEAIGDLSRRPVADLSGAVQHGMAALECVARECTGDSNATLGEMLRRHTGLVPTPLDRAIPMLWGYASDQARHGRENRRLAWEEAQLCVGIAAVLCSYLIQKMPAE